MLQHREIKRNYSLLVEFHDLFPVTDLDLAME